MSSIHQIQQLLTDVRARDRGLRVFGATSHRYITRQTSHADLDLLESRIGTPLPEEYRALLRELGCGSGPYYGVYSPNEAWEEYESLQPDPSDEMVAASPLRPFPLGVLSTADAHSMAAPFPCDGAILIGDQGSGTQWSLLVTAGAEVGTVWDAASFEGWDGEYVPARRPPGVLRESRALPWLKRPPGLLEWYAGWLEQCLADLAVSHDLT